MAKREDGQLLILPSRNPEEVGALSDPTQGYYNVSTILILGSWFNFKQSLDSNNVTLLSYCLKSNSASRVAASSTQFSGTNFQL